jgi:ketosteroid isomerase-like protein
MKYILCLTLLTIQFSCVNEEKRMEQQIQEVMDSDLAFSKMSAEQGMANAFIAYADDDVIKLNARQYPSIGKQDLARSLTAIPFSGKLTWGPLKASVGDNLAYTFGEWKMETTVNKRDTILYGNYVTIWKRQADGKWKYVLDGGNPTPGPLPDSLKARIH